VAAEAVSAAAAAVAAAVAPGMTVGAGAAELATAREVSPSARPPALELVRRKLVDWAAEGGGAHAGKAVAVAAAASAGAVTGAAGFLCPPGGEERRPSRHSLMKEASRLLPCSCE